MRVLPATPAAGSASCSPILPFRQPPPPQVWYFGTWASAVILLPFLNLFFADHGLSPGAIGLLSFSRPWLASIAGVLLPGLADRYGWHKAVMLSSFLACVLLRTAIYPCAGVPVLQAGCALVSDALASPVGVLADALVVASADDVSALIL